jgi:DNA polymerase-3 subunit gamma/tau
MSYQVLARKWRPRSFETLVGQEHVVRALTHALEQKRLHHAYLFTGTRGVGKTTLSRLLAKALNCVGPDGQGDITAKPCGVCRVCQEIDQGRFVDYIEMDAASNRGVDEMAQLLEQAVYAPSNARFKVYMIDEVHMLTNHAFNAMLKTLEEPPDYVKFILATTDPQKIPVTVLSRCLQFNLKQMPVGQIVPHLAQVLEAEGIGFEPLALPLLARGAAGSMRDALSLTDQAIAYSGERVTEQAVRAMLGTLDQTYLVRLLDALWAKDGGALLAIADEITERSLSYSAALQDLAGLLHRVAVRQSVPDALVEDVSDRAALDRFAEAFTPEEIQLDYEIVIRGRAELGLAPDEYAGFTMTLLRLLAFRPETSGEELAGPAPEAKSAATRPLTSRAALPNGRARAQDAVTPAARPLQSPRPALFQEPDEKEAARPAPAPSSSPQGSGVGFDGDWLGLTKRLKVSGLARQLVEQAELLSFREQTFHLRVPIKSLLEPSVLEKLRAALREQFGPEVRVSAQVGAVEGQTVAATERSARAERLAQAVAAIESDPFVRTLVKDFGATIVPGSIKPAP